MDKLRKIISDNIEKDDFTYYLGIIDKIEENIIDMPDISIESCKSIIEGISKKILKRLKISYIEKGGSADSPNKLLKNVLEELLKYSNIDTEFVYTACSLTLRISQIRNERGDISHGKSAPKEVFSDQNLAEVSKHITEGILCYVLNIYFSTDWSCLDDIKYENNDQFNQFLDEENQLENISYSKALYDQDIVAYKSKLSDFLSEEENL